MIALPYALLRIVCLAIPSVIIGTIKEHVFGINIVGALISIILQTIIFISVEQEEFIQSY